MKPVPAGAPLRSTTKGTLILTVVVSDHALAGLVVVIVGQELDEDLGSSTGPPLVLLYLTVRSTVW